MFRKLAGLTAVAGLFFAGSAFAAITGSAHDFTDTGEVGDGQGICVVCHVPHQSMTGVADAPLWNRFITTTSFQVYVGVELQGAITNPDGVSKLCLSCHDGTVGLDAFGADRGTAGNAALQIDVLYPTVGVGYANDTDIRNEHPISVTYVDPNLKATSSHTTVKLFANKVECASCHNVHNETGTGPTNLLVRDNSASLLCLECHDK